ncbi:DNA-binding transcriptional regulator, MarR family [Evansella caseinilytica]|uniref:DNA-binding transcriptional regulator, MarR family n=1 Tax=Evansella caseinilytica TaxID=1503961 RepID=A0A1H3SWG1_9BACI|nr:MarR family transcriptional regulator [Evansella caseinilytica]SDZ41469.1 DNA-binding transcriptional regulator, MarR family [Evansella caseinilytica]
MANDHDSIRKWISTIHRYSMTYRSRSFSQHGIGSGQLSFLSVLYQKDGISQDELAQQLHIDKTTAARAIQKLEQLGLVSRKTSTVDRRVNLVFLTQKARDIHPDILSTMQAWTDILVQGFSAAERELLLDMLKKVSRNAVDYISKLEKGGKL